MDLVFEIVFIINLVMYELFKCLGVKVIVMVGYSMGENFVLIVFGIVCFNSCYLLGENMCYFN